MIENIEKAAYQHLNELFTTAKLDEMTGDIPAYKKKLGKIAQIAQILGVETEIITVAINIKSGETANVSDELDTCVNG